MEDNSNTSKSHIQITTQFRSKIVQEQNSSEVK